MRFGLAAGDAAVASVPASPVKGEEKGKNGVRCERVRGCTLSDVRAPPCTVTQPAALQTIGLAFRSGAPRASNQAVVWMLMRWLAFWRVLHGSYPCPRTQWGSFP